MFSLLKTHPLKHPTAEGEVVIFTASSFPLSSLFLIPPPFLASFEAPIASSEALFVTLGDLSRFNGSTGSTSTSEGPIAAPIRRPHPWICSLPRVLRFDSFKIRSIHFWKSHHHTRHTTMLQASSTSLFCQPHPKSSTTSLRIDLTCGRVYPTLRRVVDAADGLLWSLWLTLPARGPHAPARNCQFAVFVPLCLLLSLDPTAAVLL
jgi:hypothetical protein